LYRIILLLAAVAVLVTGFFGGGVAHAEGEVGSGPVGFSLTVLAHFWY
jgi:hypothetical protein